MGFSNLTLSKGFRHSKVKENTAGQLQYAPNVMLVAITDLADIIKVSLHTFAHSWFKNSFRNTFHMTLVIRVLWPGSVKLCEKTGRITVEYAWSLWMGEWVDMADGVRSGVADDGGYVRSSAGWSWGVDRTAYPGKVKNKYRWPCVWRTFGFHQIRGICWQLRTC